MVSDDIQNAAFIDSINSGVKKIVTVHVLLNQKNFDRFIRELSKEGAFSHGSWSGLKSIRDGLVLYKKEITNYLKRVPENIAEVEQIGSFEEVEISSSNSDLDFEEELLKELEESLDKEVYAFEYGLEHFK